MSILDELKRKEVWEDFRQYRTDRNRLNRKQLKELDVFIAEERSLRICEDLSFSYPVKKEVNKLYSDKKRIVYSYDPDETLVLKLMSYLLYRYDDKLSDNCYSFRRNINAKTAFDRIRKLKDLDESYVLKLDIHDYFNSIDVEMLIDVMKRFIDDDERLTGFLCQLLRQDRCI